MIAADLLGDIPLDLAIAAHRGTSYAPEQRGEQERAGYASQLAYDWAALEKVCDTDEKRSQLAEEFVRYRAGYRDRYIARLSALSRCLSSMITGPSKFPSARNAKANDRAEARTTDLIEYRERALSAIRKVLCPELRPIMAGDEDATDRLAQKLDAAERLQERMKAANAAIRKHARKAPEIRAAAQVAALVALGFSEGRAKDLLTPDFMGRVGFADYQIRNNGAEIRRLKMRSAVVAEAKSTETVEIQGANARLEDCPADNRVRLFYPGQPHRDIRERLKRSGFRWTPSLTCWQAYRNTRSLAIAHAEAGIPFADGGVLEGPALHRTDLVQLESES